MLKSFGGFFICIYLSFLGYILYTGYSAELDDNTLQSDMNAIMRAYKPESLSKNFTVADVKKYYTATTDRDYMLLERAIGPGFHTRLRAKDPILNYGGHTRQPTHVFGHIHAVNAKNVVEVGFGRGYCTFYLAGLLSDVNFYGIDLTPRHVTVASETATKNKYRNTYFLEGDASLLEDVPSRVDLIFGVESLCHMDSIYTMKLFLLNVKKRLNDGGRLVIIDGFRSNDFVSAPEDYKQVMELCETGYRINQMPSKQLWIEEAFKVGLTLHTDLDLSFEALPFWELGWRFAHTALKFPWLIRYIANSTPFRVETASNLLSVATTAHALRVGTAEYGMLVFESIHSD